MFCITIQGINEDFFVFSPQTEGWGYDRFFVSVL